MPREVLFLLLLATVGTAAPSAESNDGSVAGEVRDERLKAHLQQYVGTWQGQLKQTGVETSVERSINVRQEFWWESFGLRGLAVYEQAGDIRSSESLIIIEDGRLLSHVTRDDGQEATYRGILRDGSIYWTPVNDPPLNPSTQFREWFESDDDGQPNLRSRGYVTRTRLGESVRILHNATYSHVR